MAQTAVANPPTSVTTTSAVFEGTVNPDGIASIAYFEWGETIAYGQFTDAIDVGDGVVDVPISQPVGLLQPLRNYHYRVVLES